MKYVLLTLIFAILLAGCAAPLNTRTATNYYQAGNETLSQRNLPLAKEMFSRSLINARLGGMGPEAEADVLAKLGRVFGNMCQYDEAEKAFLESISLYTKAFGETSWRLFPARLELAQFSYDVGRYEKAVVFYEQAFPSGIATLERVDPSGYFFIMKDYADALLRTGKDEQAKQTLSKAAGADGKAGTGNLTKGSAYVRYPSKCS